MLWNHDKNRRRASEDGGADSVPGTKVAVVRESAPDLIAEARRDLTEEQAWGPEKSSTAYSCVRMPCRVTSLVSPGGRK